ncbi:uncharacterized protein LOC113356245 isoform X2 [Papaver somniferum]|uniref:uncharacterized protein LOC113356245 isoform X2 n=1 Tax=Papaver somniferum TaxID=3469 RepID=UPI000E6FA5C9|nr:uncharacterized protein LOC113356245 isoform X2 [Papaver somniferum]
MEPFFKKEKTSFSNSCSQRSFRRNLQPFLIPYLLYQYHQKLASPTNSTEIGEQLVLDDPDGSFTVTAFDANHCPGAVMFLFEGNFGNILHTGDCRLTPDCLQNLPEKYLSKKGREPKCHLDYVFLDCTFGKSFLKIPSKYSAIQQVINCIWKHPNAPVVYLSCDLLGQEEILVEVSRTFGCKIYVDKTSSAEFYQALTLLAPEILSEDSSPRFHVFVGFPRLYERAKAKIIEARANSQPDPLFIRPSTQWYACEEESMEIIDWQKKQRYNEAHKDAFGVWHVCYSMHSSREELEWALQLLQPKRVVSTTPDCRAMELNYVRKQPSYGSKVASDDPLWKLLNIGSEVAPTPSSQVASCAASYSHQEENPKPISAEEYKPQPNNIGSSSSSIEMRLKLSPPSTRPPVTLFGRARQGLQNSGLLVKEAKNVSMKMNPPDTSIESEEKEIILLEDDSAEVQFKGSEEEKTEVIVIKSAVSPRRSFAGQTLSNGSFGENMRKLYRSMNVPVPRPLPSLVDLMNATKTKRARRLDL